MSVRSRVGGLFLGALAFHVVAAHGQFLPHFDGSVDLQRMPNGDVYSAGAATCYGFLEEVDFNCQVNGSHYVLDDDTQASFLFRTFNVLGEYNSFLRGTPTGDRCYRARLEAIASGKDPISRQSGRRCYPDPDNLCPLVLDLGPAGLDLTGREDPVAFDLDADGLLDHLSWTAAGSADAFLALDRNGNGVIDDGTELFGNAAPQPPSAVPNGYLALAVFDRPDEGGNGDGQITAADAVFTALRLWRDLNHDGVSQADEISRVGAHAITALDLDAFESNGRDRHGNRFRFRGKFFRAAQPPVGRTVDVFFVRVPSDGE